MTGPFCDTIGCRRRWDSASAHTCERTVHFAWLLNGRFNSMCGRFKSVRTLVTWDMNEVTCERCIHKHRGPAEAGPRAVVPLVSPATGSVLRARR